MFLFILKVTKSFLRAVECLWIRAEIPEGGVPEGRTGERKLCNSSELSLIISVFMYPEPLISFILLINI